MGKINDESFDNGTILTLSKIIKHVMTSASEAETAALFYNCKAATPLRVTAEEMGHPQLDGTRPNHQIHDSQGCKII